MKIFSEEMRYEYPLTPESVVFDVGGYEGAFAKEIFKRYGCKIYCFEPVFYRDLGDRLKYLYPEVEVHPYAIGGKTGLAKMGIKGDSTGIYADSPNMVDLMVFDVVEVLGDRKVALLKLNCEGGEFEILEAILDRGQPRLIENLQVQPHPIVPDCEARWQRIHERLLETHELVYHAPWCWSGYTIK